MFAVTQATPEVDHFDPFEGDEAVADHRVDLWEHLA
jgi:hypothetical protein